MADSLAPEDPYTTAFEARVAAVDGRDVTLERTYFYPEGGGQPAGRGTIDGVDVVDVQKGEDGVVHTLAAEPEFGIGDEVRGEIDEAFRTYCMRAHTASHVLYGAGRRLLADLGYGGFGISAAPRGERGGGDGGKERSGDGATEKVRVDFETSTEIDDALLVELERLVNRAVWDSLPVTWEEVPTEEAKARDDVAFNVATEEGAMAGSATVRTVSIGTDGEWDVAACGGTHVENTCEIGPVRVLERSNPGEGLTRVEFAVGPTAIRRQAAERRATLSAARTAGVGVTDLPDAVERLQEDVSEAEAELAALKDEVLSARLGDLDALDREERTWLVGSVDGFGPNEVGDRIQDLAGETANVIAVTGGEGRAFVVVATTGDVDANEIVQSVTDEFGGGGGGSPTFAQGGGLDADPGEIADWIRG